MMSDTILNSLVESWENELFDEYNCEQWPYEDNDDSDDNSDCDNSDEKK